MPPTERLSLPELIDLVRRVFAPRPADRGLLLLTDVPDDRRPDHPGWAARRALAADWRAALADAGDRLALGRVTLACYPNVHGNNADLPDRAFLVDAGPVPDHVDRLGPGATPMEEVLRSHSIVLAPTELSATAPLKIAAKRLGFRAATMPGFAPSMVPALRLDWEEIHARCVALKRRLDEAAAAVVTLDADGERHELRLDLRHRRATASGGLVREPGTAGNLPSGETYIVPYEGELPGDPSRTAGVLPLELDGELLLLDVEGNRVAAVRGDGPVAARERRAMEAEPAYRNLAELGLGLLADYGILPVGELLLDEKLGLHLAFGRSDHFGGTVGAADFSSPDAVVHIDRVYLPELQPRVRVAVVDLEDASGVRTALMRDGRYAITATP